MKITLYVFNGESIEINKTPNLTSLWERDDCVFRTPINVTKPVISLEFPAQIEDVDYNYCYIEGTKRYYFIVEKIRLTNKLWELHLAVDVLYTYKDSILTNIAFISRNQNDYHPYLVDMEFPISKEKTVTIRELPDVINAVTNTSFNVSDVAGNGWNTVISLSDGISTAAERIEPPIPNSKLPAIATANTNFSSRYEVTYQLADLPNFLKDSKVASFVKSIIVYPCEIPKTGDQRNLTINGEVSNVASYRVKYVPSYYMCIRDFYVPREFFDFRDYAPYSVYELWIPFVGYVELNAQDILTKNLALLYQPNFEDGSASVILYNKTDDYIVYENTCQLGVNIGINSTNTREVVANKIGNTLNLVASTAVSVMTSNPAPAIYGVARFAGNEAGNFIKGSGHISSGLAGMLSPMEPYLKITRAKTVKEYDSSYLELYGRPLNETRVLDRLTGFTKVDEVHLKNISGATSLEIDKIEALLKSGVII